MARAQEQTSRFPPPNLLILQWSLSPQHGSGPNPGIFLTFSHPPHPIQRQTCWLHSFLPPLLAALPLLEHKHNPALRPLQVLFPLPETLHCKDGRQMLLIPFRSLLKCHLLREVFSKPLYWLPLSYPESTYPFLTAVCAQGWFPYSEHKLREGRPS